jgi:hypothetical protein
MSFTYIGQATSIMNNDDKDQPSVKQAAHAASVAVESKLKGPSENATVRTALMGCAGASLLASIMFKIRGADTNALFVGQWVAPFLLIALWTQVIRSDISPKM